jgi:hypothetical protein
MGNGLLNQMERWVYPHVLSLEGCCVQERVLWAVEACDSGIRSIGFTECIEGKVFSRPFLNVLKFYRVNIAIVSPLTGANCRGLG